MVVKINSAFNLIVSLPLMLRSLTLFSSALRIQSFLLPISVASKNLNSCNSVRMASSWKPDDPQHVQDAKSILEIWPLDEYNVKLLNEVHPRDYKSSTDEPHEIYDLIAIGAGAGGLVSSKQAARRGAKSAMITEKLAGGDCLNVGCVPSKGLIRAARAVAEVKRASEFGIVLPAGEIKVDFPAIMSRMRKLRAKISPADGHGGTAGAGAHVFQGRGKFVDANTIEVNGTKLKFKKAVVATGGRPSLPNIPGLAEAPYTTNEKLFNLETLPPRMVILGAGVIALEMAQTFSSFGSKVTVIQRSERLFQSKGGDAEAGELLQTILERGGVTFITGTTSEVTTLQENDDKDTTKLPLLGLKVKTGDRAVKLECECLLVATGRQANVENLGLEEANVDFKLGKGITVNDLAQTSNPNVYAVGDCVADVPRLTHMSGEMAKLIVQNSLFADDWKLSSLVVPSVMYTHPEYATVGVSSEEVAEKKGIAVDVYRAGLEHNDRAILESANEGFCKIICKAGTDEVLGATIVAERAGEMLNEVSLAIKNGVGLKAIGRNIHSYPTTGEAVMGCGVQYINSHWDTLN